jgi:aminopeptidase N
MHTHDAPLTDPLTALHGHALPGDRPFYPRDRRAATRHLRIDARLDVDAQAIDATATHYVTPLDDGIEAIDLDAADMVIERVEVAGAQASFTHDGSRLRIELDPPRDRGEEFRVAISYRATPRVGLYFTAPDDGYPDKPRQVWSQCQDNDAHHWVPCLDDPNGRQTTEMIATVPGSWFALSNGRLIEDKQNRDGTRTLHWVQDRPHSIYLLTLAAGEFSRIDAGEPGGLTIDYFLEPGTEEDGVRAFHNTPAMIALFEQLTAMPYPWAKYSQIVVRDFVFGGMENTSATTMTELLLIDEKAAVDTTGDYLVSHELAHQWFGDLLTCRDWSHGWLNEGFASYFEALWEEHHRGADEYRQYLYENADLYFTEAGQFTRPIVSRVWNEPIDIFDRHLYEKGALVLHMLRTLLGDAAFFRSLQRYTRDNQDTNVVTQDLIDAIEEETGRRLDWFFDQWVFRPGHPKLDVSWSWDGDTRLATVTVKQTQDTEKGTAIFRTPVTIDFWKDGIPLREYTVELSEAEHRFVLPLDNRPDYCRFDPQGQVLAELTFDKTVDELRAQLAGDESPGRAWAARQLGRKGSSPAAIEALEAALTGDAFWGVQVAAAEGLGELRSTAARDALIRGLAVEHPKARRAVVKALGNFRGDERAFEAIAPFAREDASWHVEAEANRAAGRLRVDGAWELIASNLERRSYREVVHVGCLDGLADLRDPRGFDVMLASARYGQPPQRRPAALRAIAKLARYFPERRAALSDDIVTYLHDPDLRVRLAAAQVLRDLCQRPYAAELDAMAARELDGRAVKTARQAARALRGEGDNGEVAGIRDEVEKLRREQVQLHEEIDRLRALVDRANSSDNA